MRMKIKIVSTDGRPRYTEAKDLSEEDIIKAMQALNTLRELGWQFETKIGGCDDRSRKGNI